MKTSPPISTPTINPPVQPIDIHQLKHNLKSQINPDHFLSKYSPQNQFLNKCLPPKFTSQPIFGQLLIKFESILFLSHVPISKSKHVIYRCRMLGYTQEETPFLSKSITYTIHTNNKMFKHYLKDMKVCIVEVLDARNYEPLGHSYINWLTYMKSIEDNEPLIDKIQNKNKYEEQVVQQKKYFLPFLDEECFLTLPLFDFRTQKTLPKSPSKCQDPQSLMLAKSNPKERIIGQIQLKFMSRIYQNPIAPGYSPFQREENLAYNPDQNSLTEDIVENENRANVHPTAPSYLDIPIPTSAPSQKNMISLKSILHSNKQILPPVRFESSESEINHKQPETIQLRRQPQPSNRSSFNVEKQSSKIYNPTGSKIYNQEDFERSRNHRPSYDRATNKTEMTTKTFKSHELEHLHLKLDAQEFFKLSEQEKAAKNQEKIVVEITKLKTKLQNINQLDVYLNQNEEELYSQNKQVIASKPHIKIYKISTDKPKSEEFFNSKLIVERPLQRIVEIHLPNNQGKCIFRCKDLTANSNDICIYNKGVIVGVLTVRKETERRNFISGFNSLSKNDDNKIEDSELNLDEQKIQKDKICIVVVENFTETFHKKSDLNQLSALDNYCICLKNIHFFHEALNNSKQMGEYSVTSCQLIPKIFAVEVKNSSNQFVGMSENITFEGNKIPIVEQNIMPILILQKNISIPLKQMPVFKKLPNSITFRLSLYIANTQQLNFFMRKWKENVIRHKTMQTKKQRSLSNARPIGMKNTQKIRQKQYTNSDEIVSEAKNDDRRIRTQSDNRNSVNANNYHYLESKSSDVRQTEKERFKTQGNYTEDLNNDRLIGNGRSEIKEQEEQYSHKQDYEEEEIYLVEFFCKSLHYVLSRLGSKKIIEQKITELTNYQYTKRVVQTDQSRTVSEDNSVSQGSKGLVSKEQFSRILSILVFDNKEAGAQVLGFDVNQILQALFVSEDGEFIKMQEFTLCLMAYYNFMLLLTNQKLNALKEVITCEPEAESKLSKIQESMTNINSEFLWEDLLPNVIEKTKQKVNKRYRIYPNAPFSVNLLLKDLLIAKKNLNDQNDESLFMSLLNILSAEEEKKYELFMRTTADLGNLVRQTVEEIIFTQCIKSSNVIYERNWIRNALQNIDEFIQKQNLESISSDSKNQFCFNLSQFQEFFSQIGIDTSIWESLMLIEEIKVWHQGDEFKEKENLETGEGIIAVQLVKSWLNALNTKIQIRNTKREARKQINTKSSRLNSVKSLDSDEQDIIEQMNKKKSPKNFVEQIIQNNGNKVIEAQKSPINKILGQQYDESIMNNRNQPQVKEKEHNSFKQSQTMNNESDIANIANLLRQNSNNLYFLPSLNDPNSLNRITSANNILSNEHILRGLDQNSIRNVGDPSPIVKQIPKQLKNQKEIEQIESDSSQMRESEESRVKQVRGTKNDPIFGYVSVKMKQLKLKRNDLLLEKEGLKKLCLSLNKNLTKSQESFQDNQQSHSKHKQHFFLSEQTLHKILFSNTSESILPKYSLKNFKININNLYEFQTLFSQGLSFEILNLKRKDSKQSSKFKSKNLVSQEKVQEVLLSGILPVEDIVKLVQEYKKINEGQKDGKTLTTQHSKKKTIVLYHGRQIIGKAIVEVIVSEKQLSEIDQNSLYEDLKLTKLEFSFVKKELFNAKSKSKQSRQYPSQTSQPLLMSVSYCSIRNEQKVINVLPQMEENSIFQIELPEPIIEYQLILRSVKAEDKKVEKEVLQGQNLSGLSRLTRFEKECTVEPSCKASGECVIPLESLYFKKIIEGEYPLIDQETGRFISSISISLKIVEQEIEETEFERGKTEESELNQ